MRRCLHSFLVGLLVLATSADAARACWLFGRSRLRSSRAVAMCPPPSWACTPAAGLPIIHDEVREWDGIEACGCGPDVAESVDGAEIMAVEFEVATAAADAGMAPVSPAPAEAADERPAAASVLTLPEEGLPDLDPVAARVQQASAAEAIPKPDSEADASPAGAGTTPVVEDEENLFVLADAVRAEGGNLSGRDVPGEAVEPPAADGQEPESDADSAPPAEPANPLDAAERSAGEPARLWVDATGRHAVVGVLVDVRDDGTCVLDTGSGMVGVAVEALCRRDREYAEQAAARLVARERPAATATAAR